MDIFYVIKRELSIEKKEKVTNRDVSRNEYFCGYTPRTQKDEL
jgi:hypothetical protein